MSEIIISGEVLNTPWRAGGSTGELRIYSHETWVTSDGFIVSAGSHSNESEPYRSVTITVTGTQAELDSCTLDSTVDTLSNTRPRYWAGLFDSSGNYVQTFLADFEVPATPTSTSWDAIFLYNDTRRKPRLDVSDFYTKNQIGALFVNALQAGLNVVSYAYTSLAALTSTLTGAVVFCTTLLRGLYYKTKANVWCSLTGRANVLDHDLVGDGATDCRSLLNTLCNTTLSTIGGIVYFPHYQSSANTDYLISSNLTIPANVTLEFAPGARLKVATGVTLTIQGDINARPRHIFNLVGTGTLSLASNNVVSTLYPEWFGAKADNSTDSTTAIQAAIDVFGNAGKSGVVQFQDGKYVISGALTDTSLSNAQVTFPKRGTLQAMITVHLRGSGTPATPWNLDSGTIIRSTLSSGSGVVFGVKNDQGATCADATCVASNNSSNIFVKIENITIRQKANPTNSTLDLSHVRNLELRNVRLDTDDFGSGGTMPALLTGSPVIPDVIVTQPTTSTSYGLNLPTNLPNSVAIDGLFVGGMYTAIRTGELAKARNIVIHGCYRGFQVEGAIWPSVFENVVIAATRTPIIATGAKPDQSGYPDTVNTAQIYFNNVGVENDTRMAWSGVNYVVDDASGYLIGGIRNLFYGAGATVPANPARPARFFWTRWEFPESGINPTPVDGPLSVTQAVDETRNGIDDAGANDYLAWKILTATQSGTNAGVGVFTIANDSVADNSEKRLFQLFTATDGAINSGLTSFATTNTGTLATHWYFDKYGNFINLAFNRSGEVGPLSPVVVTSNTVAAVNQVVHVQGPATISTITFPDVTSAPIPVTAFYVTLIARGGDLTINTAGNIEAAVTIPAGRAMTFTCSSNTNKCYPSA